jgi:hypothetical protein
MRVRVTACVCVCLMRLLLAKTFNIVSFEKKRIKKEGLCAICGDYERREKKERERERERDPCFFRVLVCRLVLFFVVKKETRRRANALTSSYNNKVIIL